VIPLPEPYTEQVIEYSGIAVNRTDKFPLFTADQMHAYAAASVAEAVLQERERCAGVCEALELEYPSSGEAGWYAATIECAAAIRAGGKG
jgi:hypothetical protein